MIPQQTVLLAGGTGSRLYPLNSTGKLFADYAAFPDTYCRIGSLRLRPIERHCRNAKGTVARGKRAPNQLPAQVFGGGRDQRGLCGERFTRPLTCCTVLVCMLEECKRSDLRVAGIQVCFGEGTASKVQSWITKHYNGNLHLTVNTLLFQQKFSQPKVRHLVRAAQIEY